MPIGVDSAGDEVAIGDGNRWDLRPDDDRETTADVTITATGSALVRFLTAPPHRDPHPEGVEITGKPRAIRAFLKAIEVFPLGSAGRPAQ